MRFVEFTRGEVVRGRYKLAESLGSGGMAAVWRAEDKRNGAWVAVKFMRPSREEMEALDTPEGRAVLGVLEGRFRREADLLGRLAHRGIPRLLDTGSYHTVPYIVMELVDGEQLGKYRYLSSLSVAAAAAVGHQIADALAAAHRGDIVHRDLKPANVVIARSGVCALIDFGIAKPLGTNVTSYTRSGSTLGSTGYQAPEQLKGRAPTTRTDIYSLGCVFYRLFAGRPPFLIVREAPLPCEDALREMHLCQIPDPVRKHLPHVPQAIDDLIARMLGKDPQDRPGIDEVLDILAPFLPREGDPAPQPRLDPDPTLPFRMPDGVPQVVPPVAVAVAPSRSWLTVGEIDRMCAMVEAELAADDPDEPDDSDDAVRRLVDCAPRARAELGFRNARVVRIWGLAAEGLRLLGECGRAAEFYRDLLDDSSDARTPAALADRTRWALRFAECRLFFYEIAGAVEALREAAPVIARLPVDLAAPVREARSELEANVRECSTDPDIDELLRSFRDG